MDILDLMLLPALECLILVGIHSYLGLHVIRRRVIFVDLALAQIAALGTTMGFVFGIMPDTLGGFLYSLTFCVLGAALFAFTRIRDDRVPQEAVIGLVYAITAALAILVVQKTKGIEHMEGILVGSLLWVSWADVVSAGLAYSIIGVIHWIFRKPFMAISDDPQGAYARGLNVRGWDFLFYLTFGFVITFSVRVAGVLLVFVFLVAPAILASLVTRDMKRQLLVGWAAGTVVTVLGLYLAYVLDLPCGPTVVAFYAVVLAAVAAAYGVMTAAHRGRALATTLAGMAGLAALGYGLALEGRALAAMEGTELGHHGHVHGCAHGRAHAAPAAPAPPAPAVDEEDEIDPEFILEAARSGEDLTLSERLQRLVDLLADPATPPFYREEGLALFIELAGRDFGFTPDDEPTTRTNRAALQVMRRHAGQTGPKVSIPPSR
jgi:zinc/manganese transport system permease protein